MLVPKTLRGQLIPGWALFFRHTLRLLGTAQVGLNVPYSQMHCVVTLHQLKRSCGVTVLHIHNKVTFILTRNVLDCNELRQEVIKISALQRNIMLACDGA